MDRPPSCTTRSVKLPLLAVVLMSPPTPESVSVSESPETRYAVEGGPPPSNGARMATVGGVLFGLSALGAGALVTTSAVAEHRGYRRFALWPYATAAFAVGGSGVWLLGLARRRQAEWEHWQADAVSGWHPRARPLLIGGAAAAGVGTALFGIGLYGRVLCGRTELGCGLAFMSVGTGVLLGASGIFTAAITRAWRHDAWTAEAPRLSAAPLRGGASVSVSGRF